MNINPQQLTHLLSERHQNEPDEAADVNIPNETSAVFVIGLILGVIFIAAYLVYSFAVKQDAQTQSIVFFQLIIGVAVGLVPATLGAIKNKLLKGFGGLIGCVMASLLFGWLFAVLGMPFAVWGIYHEQKATRISNAETTRRNTTALVLLLAFVVLAVGFYFFIKFQ